MPRFCRALLAFLALLSRCSWSAPRAAPSSFDASRSRHRPSVLSRWQHRRPVADGQFDLPRAREGGVNAMFFSLFVTEEYYPQQYETRQALRLLDLALRQIQRTTSTIELALQRPPTSTAS